MRSSPAPTATRNGSCAAARRRSSARSTGPSSSCGPRWPTSRSRKKELLRQVFGAGVTSLTMRFLYLLVDKRREEILPYVNTEFKQLSYRFRHILPVTVRAATRLTAEERQRLTQALAAKTGQT